jgi:hypothetical protein
MAIVNQPADAAPSRLLEARAKESYAVPARLGPAHRPGLHLAKGSGIAE